MVNTKRWRISREMKFDGAELNFVYVVYHYEQVSKWKWFRKVTYWQWTQKYWSRWEDESQAWMNDTIAALAEVTEKRDKSIEL